MIGLLTPAINDNHSSREIYLDDTPFGCCGRLLPFMPLARSLIARHGTKWWKNHVNSFDYVLAEHGLCCHLESIIHSREHKGLYFRFMAITLGVNPLVLHNDEDIEERLRSLSHL